MKAILLLILLFCTFFCKAQQKDTVLVIMLVSDTTLLTTHFPYAMKGYSVRKKINANDESNGDWFCATCKDYWEHEFYLDGEEKRLNSKLLVWQSTPVKYNPKKILLNKLHAPIQAPYRSHAN